jgi:hypothetical protein
MRLGERRRLLHEAVRPISGYRQAAGLGRIQETDVVYIGDRSCRLVKTESLPYEMFSASATFRSATFRTTVRVANFAWSAGTIMGHGRYTCWKRV